MRSGYSDVNWFLRAARVVPVIAGAALLGGMIGGFAMFAVDSALTCPGNRFRSRGRMRAPIVRRAPWTQHENEAGQNCRRRHSRSVGRNVGTAARAAAAAQLLRNQKFQLNC